MVQELLESYQEKRGVLAKGQGCSTKEAPVTVSDVAEESPCRIREKPSIVQLGSDAIIRRRVPEAD